MMNNAGKEEKQGQISVLAPGMKDTIDEMTLSCSPWPQATSTESRPPSLNRKSDLQDDLSMVKRFDDLFTKMPQFDFNGNNASDVGDNFSDSSLGLIKMDSMEGMGKSFKPDDYDFDIMDKDSFLLPNPKGRVIVNALDIDSKTAEVGGVKTRTAKFSAPQNSDVDDLSSTTPQRKVSLICEGENDDLLSILLKPKDDHNAHVKNLLEDFDASSFHIDDVYTNSDAQTRKSENLINFQSNADKEIISDISINNCVKNGREFGIMDDVVFQDEDGEYVTNLAYHTGFNSGLLNEESNQASLFGDEEFDNFVPAVKGLEIFEKDEQKFIKESKFKINNSVVNTTVNVGENSWMIPATQDVTRPSWLSPPSNEQSFMRISIGQLFGARTEALGSLGHEDEAERPNFGKQIFSPPHVFSTEVTIYDEPNNGNISPIKQQNKTLVSGNRNAEQLSTNESKVCAETTVCNPDKAMVSINKISKLLNEASISTDPKALAEMIIKISKGKDYRNSVLEEKDTISHDDDSLDNWIDAVDTVKPLQMKGLIGAVNEVYGNPVVNMGGSIKRSRKEPCDETLEILASGNDGDHKDKLPKFIGNMEAEDRFSPSLNSTDSSWKKARLSSIYFKKNNPLTSCIMDPSFQQDFDESISTQIEDKIINCSKDIGKISSLGRTSRISAIKEDFEEIKKTSRSYSELENSPQLPKKYYDQKKFGDRNQNRALIEIPEVVNFGKVMCRGISSTSFVSMKNLTSEWMNCNLRITNLVIDGRSVGLDESSIVFMLDKQITLPPSGTERQKITLLAQNSGSYRAVLEVNTSPISWNKNENKMSAEVVVSAEVEEPKIKILADQSNGLEFGDVLESCSVTKAISIVNLGESILPIRLRIKNDGNISQNFKFCETNSRSNACTVLSPSILSLSLPESKWIEVKITCQGNFPHSGDGQDINTTKSLLCTELDVPNSQPVSLTEPFRLSAVISVVKLHIKCDSEPMIIQSLVNQESRREVQLRNSGKGFLHLRVNSNNQSCFSLEPSELALYPSQQGSVSVIMKPQSTSKSINMVMFLMVQPNGQVYEVNVIGDVRNSKQAANSKPTANIEDLKSNLQSNKHQLSWAGVAVGSTEVQQLVLRNSNYEDSVSLKAFVKGSKDFMLIDTNDQAVETQELTLLPRKECTVKVIYSPKAISVTEARVIFRLVSDKPSNVKFSVKLSAYSGSSKLDVKGVHQENLSGTLMSCYMLSSAGELKTCNATVKNNGDRSMFVKVLFFKDTSCKKLVDEDCCNAEPNEFVLNPESEKVVLLTLKPNNVIKIGDKSYFGSAYFITGDEISRQKLRAAKQKNLFSKKRSYIDRKDPIAPIIFDGPYKNESKYQKGINGSGEDVLLFYMQLSRLPVMLLAKNSSCSINDSSFMSLNVDETRDSICSQNLTLRHDDCDIHLSSSFKPKGSPPVKDVSRIAAMQTPSLPSSIAKKLWDVIPSEISMENANQPKQSVYLLNYSDKNLRYKISWPTEIFSVVPSRGVLHSKENHEIKISLNEGHEVERNQVSHITVTCENQKKEIQINLSRIDKSDSWYKNREIEKHSQLGRSRSIPFHVNQNVSFDETFIGSSSSEDLEMFNASFHSMNWNMIPSSLYYKDSNLSSFNQVPFSIFSFDKLSGVLKPRQRTCLKPTFYPTMEGEFKQIWTVNVISKEHYQVKIEIIGKSKKNVLRDAQDFNSSSKPVPEIINEISTSSSKLSKHNLDKFTRTLNDNLGSKEIPVEHQTRESSNSQDNKPSALKKPSQRKNCIFVMQEKIIFTSAAINSNNSMKVMIKNASNRSYRLKVLKPEPPFFVSHHILNIKAKSYVSFPVLFKPETVGLFEGKLKIDTELLYSLDVSLQGLSTKV